MQITKLFFRIKWKVSGLEFCLVISEELLNILKIRTLYFACFRKFYFPYWRTIISGEPVTKLIIFTSINISFQSRKVRKFGEKLFVYGRDGAYSSRKIRPTTTWKITVAADQQFIDFLHSEKDSKNMYALTDSSFLEVKVDVKCRQVKST